MQLDRIPTSARSPAWPQSNQHVWVLPAISRDVYQIRDSDFEVQLPFHFSRLRTWYRNALFVNDTIL